MLPSPRRFAPLALLTLCMLLSAACDDDTTPEAASGTPDVGAAVDADPNPEPDAASDAAPEPDAPGEEDPQLTLAVEPSAPTLEVEVGQPRTLDFNAVAVNADTGAANPVQATWSVSDLRLGSIDPGTGVFTADGDAGSVQITAAWEGLTATTTLTVRTRWRDNGVTDADIAAFDGAPDGQDDRGPRLLYPEDGTLFFKNITGVALQWEGRGRTLFRVRLQGPGVDWVVYTRQSVWTPPDTLWEQLIRELGGQPVTVAVDGASTGEVTPAANTTSFSFAEDVVEGAIYYWSTADSGILRLPIDEDAPEPFFTPSSPAGSPCTGCHAISRDGRRIAFNTAPLGLPIGPLMAVDTADPTQRIINLTQNINGMQPTFSPDNSRIVAGWEGVLTERYTDGTCRAAPGQPCATAADCPSGACVTGEPIQTVPTPGDYKAGFADWAPNDGSLVASITNTGIAAPIGIDFEFTNGGLMLVRRNDDATWGTPEVILPPPSNPNDGNAQPAFSPDSRWIAFSHIGPGLAGVTGQVVDSDLYLMSPTARVPVPLLKAHMNEGFNNNWPKWAPTRGQYLWLAFSSTRPYGSTPTPNGPQIWITAIDPAKAAQGEDPSTPAFWLPHQNTNSGNHIPYWAPYIKEPTPPGRP